MNNSRKRSLTLFLLWLIILSNVIVCKSGQQNEEKPSTLQFVSSTLSLLKKSHKNSWEKIKAIIHDFQLQFTPPNLDFRSTDTANSVGGKMKEAVEKSVGTGEVIVEETAKSAAEAFRKTADKVKESASDNRESHDEL
ncbi:hypothetical protein PTKIN_Ptkin07bG0083300 [Pterospermum kingtungense]